MSIISTWINTLIGAVLIGAVLEMILPDNSFKKYLRLIVGVALVTTLVAPFAGGVGANLSTVSVDSHGIEDTQKQLNKFQNSQIMNTYKVQLEKSFEKNLPEIKKFSCKTEVVLQESNADENVARISKITITAAKKMPPQDIADIKGKISAMYGVGIDKVSIH